MGALPPGFRTLSLGPGRVALLDDHADRSQVFGSREEAIEAAWTTQKAYRVNYRLPVIASLASIVVILATFVLAVSSKVH